MTLFVWPTRYAPLQRRGEWRLSIIAIKRPHIATRTQRYPEGTVYQVWVAWLLVKLMVKA